MVHAEDSVLTDPEDDNGNDHAMASAGQKEENHSSKQGEEPGGALGAIDVLARVAASSTRLDPR